MPRRKIGHHETILIIKRSIEGYTNEQIGEELGVTHQAISRVLKKPMVRNIREEMLERIQELQAQELAARDL